MRRHFSFVIVLLISLVIWGDVGLQFYLFMEWAHRHGIGQLGGLWNFLSYFTNLSNLMAALVLTYVLIKWFEPQYLKKIAPIIAGVTLYVVMAGIIFNLELRQSSPQSGLAHTANVLLHDVNPLLLMAFWLFMVPYANFSLRHALRWLSFPVVYFAFTLVRGEIFGRYPYPFLDVAKYGHFFVLSNGVEMRAGFIVMGLFIVALDRIKPLLSSYLFSKR